MGKSSSEEESAVKASDVSLSVSYIGGIDQAEVAFSSGVTLLTGQNATNRTSLLRAVAGALGGTAGTLKRDAEEGHVTLAIGDETYSREYERAGSTVHATGSPYTEETELVDLFVSLLSDNPIRHAVESDTELAELLLEPLDTAAIERQISEAVSQRNHVDERLSEIEREERRLPNLEQRKSELESDLADVESELEETMEAIKSADEVDDANGAEPLLDELEQLRGQLEQQTSELQTQKQVRDELQEKREEVTEELNELPDPDEELSVLEQEIEGLQRQKNRLTATINDLSSIINRNEDLLANEDGAVDELRVDDGPVSALDEQSQTVECWTCGSQVEQGEIANQLRELEALVAEKRDERAELRDRLSKLESKRDEIRQTRRRREDLQNRVEELHDEIDRRNETITTLEDEVESLRDQLEDLEADLEDAESIDSDGILADYKRVSELEYERGRLETEIEDISEKVTEIEYQIGKREELEAQRENLTEKITDLRSRITDVQRRITEQFNDHMTAILDRLQYENVERIWLERLEDSDTDHDVRYDLHVVRETEDGSVYEDSIDHLSESEREVIGLVVALAGYRVYEVHRTVPMILLDSLESIDANRIATLVDYFDEYTDFLLVALLEEDAAALPESYDRIHAAESLSS